MNAYSIVLAAVYLLGFLGEPYLHKQVTLVMFSLFAGLISAEQLDDRQSASSGAVKVNRYELGVKGAFTRGSLTLCEFR